jgi:hypothetical protein
MGSRRLDLYRASSLSHLDRRVCGAWPGVVWRFLESEAPHIGVTLDLTRPRAERRTELHLGGADDLFEYQSSPRGGWLVLDVARYAIRAGITWPGVAGYSWVTVAVGSQLGFHLDYPGHPCEPAGIQPRAGPVIARAAPKKASCKKIK